MSAVAPGPLARYVAELDQLSPAEVFLRYHGATPAARRELANGYEPPEDDVRWMRMELAERMEHDERQRCA